MCVSFASNTQTVFAVPYENQADIKVYVVKYENEARRNNGAWFFTKYENQADLKIYVVKYKNQAGLRDTSKQYLTI